MSCAELCQTGFLTLCGDSEPRGGWNNYPRDSWPQQNRLERLIPGDMERGYLSKTQKVAECTIRPYHKSFFLQWMMTNMETNIWSMCM